MALSHRKHISLKQKQWVKGYLTHGNGTQAAADVYNVKDRKNAARLGTNNLKSPIVAGYMREILDKTGLDDDAIAGHLKKIIVAGTSEYSLKNAKVADSLRGLEMINRLKDNYPVEKKQIETRSASIKLDLKGKSSEELVKVLEGLSKELLIFKRMVNNVDKITEGEVVKSGQT